MIDPTEYLIDALMGTGVNRATAEQQLAEHDAAKATALLNAAVKRLDERLLTIRAENGDPIRVKRSTTDLCDAVGVLRRMADEIRENTVPAGVTDTPDFFQPGHTYTDGTGHTAPEITTTFRVEHVTRHPDRGHFRAIGWARTGAPDAGWHGDFRDEGEYADWTDITATTPKDNTA